MKTKLCAVMIFVGLFLMLGTAGASDADMITIQQLFVRFGLGFLLSIVGWGCLYYITQEK